MAEDGLLHTADLLKTALPYVDVKSRLTLELLVKLYELIICMRNYTNNDISACGFENDKADMEALLNIIRPKCSINEQAFVDKMLNIFQAKKMFEMYNTYMEAMNAMEGFDGFACNKSDIDDDSASEATSSTSFMNSFKDYDFSSILGDDDNSDTLMHTYNSMTSDKPDDEANDDKDMFEELKALIPPEQMQAYENLRMLFGSMSYDDSNKVDESKE